MLQALEAAAEKTVAELRARADAAGRDRDELRARLTAADAGCAAKARAPSAPKNPHSASPEKS